jgi:predicted TIM-barrel fold metal-dependent hydrolase
MIIDIHCHCALTQRPARVADRFSFEPAEVDGKAAFDSCMSPRVLRRPTWRLLQRMFGLDPKLCPGPELDQQVKAWYAAHLGAPGPVERFVLLAFDRYHDDAGRVPPLPETRAQLGSDMYVSNTMVRDICRRNPQRFLFGASVHPYRENALACLDEVFAAGACLLKWIPLHQNINCRDPRTIAVLRRCAELGLPLLMHYGPEFTLTTQHSAYLPVAPLLDVLRTLRREDRMPTVICAHAATPAIPWQSRASFRALCAAMLGEFADAPLYADISAMTAWTKIGFLRQLARRQELHSKLLFGSDFPVPLAMPRLWPDLGWSYTRVASDPSWPQRAARIYRHLGFNEIVFHHAASLLPHIDHFARA